MDNFDRAVERIKGTWPADPCWIFTSPDNGETVFRNMRSDVCPECFRDSNGQPARQLYSLNGKVVSRYEDYGKQETV